MSIGHLTGKFTKIVVFRPEVMGDSTKGEVIVEITDDDITINDDSLVVRLTPKYKD